MLTKEQINKAKQETEYSNPDPLHQKDDCIRMAYEWLDAQNITKNPLKRPYAMKHLVEQWAGRYVSQSDVEVAAHLHQQIFGDYPHYNISSKLTEPSTERLKGISEANTHKAKRDQHDPKLYKIKEIY